MIRSFLLVFVFASISLSAQQQVSVEQVVALAIEKNYDIRIAKSDADFAKVDDQYANGAFLPRVNATGGIVWNQNDQLLRVRDTANVLNDRTGKAASNNMTASVALEWRLFDGGKMFATRERVALIAEQGELLLKNQIVNTIAQVVNNYYDVVRQKQQLRAIEEQMSLSEERVKLAERRFQVGTGAKPELLQARVDYNAQRAQAIQQRSAIEQLKAQLNALVGMQLPPSFDIADSIAIDTTMRRDDLEEKIASGNYSLQAAEQGMRIASLSVRERRAERFPLLDFNAAYNYSRLDNTKLLNPFSPQFIRNNGFNYGLTLSVPILNGFNQRRLIQQSRVAQIQQEQIFRQQQINVDVSFYNAYTNYQNAIKILEVEEENIGFARENVTIAMEVFRRGASTFVELRTAQQSLADAYTRLINARYLAKLAETELLRLNGSLLR